MTPPGCFSVERNARRELTHFSKNWPISEILKFKIKPRFFRKISPFGFDAFFQELASKILNENEYNIYIAKNKGKGAKKSKNLQKKFVCNIFVV